MSGNLTDFSENKLLEHITGKTAYAKPTNTYLGLFLVVPADDGTGGTEVASSGGYARVQISWGSASAGSIANNANIRFPSANNATSNWGTILGVGIWDTLTVGNLLWYGSLASSVTINSGDNWTLTTGAVTLSLD